MLDDFEPQKNTNLYAVFESSKLSSDTKYGALAEKKSKKEFPHDSSRSARKATKSISWYVFEYRKRPAIIYQISWRRRGYPFGLSLA